MVITEEAATQADDVGLVAQDLFLGPFREVITFSVSLGAFFDQVDLFALSARHGFVPGDTALAPYEVVAPDRTMVDAPRGERAVLQAVQRAVLVVVALPESYLRWLDRAGRIALFARGGGHLVAIAGRGAASILRATVPRDHLTVLPRAGVARIGTDNQEFIRSMGRGLKQS